MSKVWLGLMARGLGISQAAVVRLVLATYQEGGCCHLPGTCIHEVVAPVALMGIDSKKENQT